GRKMTASAKSRRVICPGRACALSSRPAVFGVAAGMHLSGSDRVDRSGWLDCSWAIPVVRLGADRLDRDDRCVAKAIARHAPAGGESDRADRAAGRSSLGEFDSRYRTGTSSIGAIALSPKGVVSAELPGRLDPV